MGAIGAPPEKNHNATFKNKSICQPMRIILTIFTGPLLGVLGALRLSGKENFKSVGTPMTGRKGVMRL